MKFLLRCGGYSPFGVGEFSIWEPTSLTVEFVMEIQPSRFSNAIQGENLCVCFYFCGRYKRFQFSYVCVEGKQHIFSVQCD